MQWAIWPTGQHGGSTAPRAPGGSRDREGSSGDSRGPFAHPGCAHGPLFDLAQALLTDELVALGGHAVHVQIVQQQSLCVLAQGVGLDHTLCEHAWVLSTEEKLDPRHPVLAGEEGVPSWARQEREGNAQHSQTLWARIQTLLLIHGGPAHVGSLF